MPAVAAVTLEGIKVTELAVGSVLGVAIGAAAGLLPRLRPLLPLAAAVVGVLLLAGFGVADGWVVAAIAVPTGASGLSAFVLQRPGSSVAMAGGISAAGAVVGASLLGPAAAHQIDVPRPAVVVAFAVLAGLASLASDRHLRGTAVVTMGAWTAFGLFLCNPDTEGSSLVGSLLAAGAVVATVVAATRRRAEGDGAEVRSTPLLPGRAVPLVLVLVWVGVHGADGREDTIIGGYACLGVLLVLPLALGVSLLVPRQDRPSDVLSGRLLTAVQAPLVVVCARIGGIRTTAERAVLVSAASLALATAVLTVALGHRPRDERSRQATSQAEP